MIKGSYGLAWYSNTTTLEPVGEDKHLIINDLYIEGIDYLQVFGSGRKIRRSKRFKFNDLERPTRMYKKSYLVTDEKLNLKVCVLNREPASPVLPEGCVSIKFDNELLYLKVFNYKYVKAFFRSIGFDLKYISRLDVYRDFQKFKTVMPFELIRNFAQEKWLCLSRAKFDMIGVNNKEGLSYQYLRNGKKNSGRQFYLYNKSIELREVGIKDHVVETWKIAGFNDMVDVWRLELSMTRAKRNEVLNEDTAEVIGMDLRNVFKKEYLKKCFEGGLKSSFRFVVNQGRRKTRCKKVKLFGNQRRAIRLIFGGSQCDNLRMRKIIVRSLIKDILNDKERREHKTRSVEEQIRTVKRYVKENFMDQHLLKIIWSLAYEFKIDFNKDVGLFIYGYFKMKGYDK